MAANQGMHWLEQGKRTRVTSLVKNIAARFSDIGSGRKSLEADVSTVEEMTRFLSAYLKPISVGASRVSVNRQVSELVRRAITGKQTASQALLHVPWRRSASQILSDKTLVPGTLCTDYAHCMIALLKAKSVPARLVKSFGVKGRTTSAVEFLLGGKWHSIVIKGEDKAFPIIVKGLFLQRQTTITIRGIDSAELGLTSFAVHEKAGLDEKLACIMKAANIAVERHGKNAVKTGKYYPAYASRVKQKYCKIR